MLFLLLHPPIFPSYILTRLREYGLSNQWPDAVPGSWQRAVWNGITRLENFARLWELGGWIALLWDGRYVPCLLLPSGEISADHYSQVSVTSDAPTGAEVDTRLSASDKTGLLRIHEPTTSLEHLYR